MSIAPATKTDPQETLARWEADEQRVRASLAKEPGWARPEQLAGRSGIEQLQGIFTGEIGRPPIGQLMDFLPVEITPGYAVFQGRPSKRHYNPLGTVHGGWFATLLDSALGVAVHSALPAGKGYTTLELKVNMIRALTDKVPLVRAEGRIIHLGGQTATADARLVGPDGRLYAHASTTCLVFDSRAQSEA